MAESKMPARTPGPWRAKGRTIMNADGVKIATVTVHSGGKNFKPNDVAETNAEFIVAACNRADLAEQMAEALRAHDAYMTENYGSDPDSKALHPAASANWKRVRAAISAWEAAL